MVLGYVFSPFFHGDLYLDQLKCNSLRQHCSSSQVSLCTGKAFRDFFVNGVLPPNGKVCATTETLFPPVSVNQLGEKSSGEDREEDLIAIWGAQTVQETSEEDMALLKKLKAFGEVAQEGFGGFQHPRSWL